MINIQMVRASACYFLRIAAERGWTSERAAAGATACWRCIIYLDFLRPHKHIILQKYVKMAKSFLRLWFIKVFPAIPPPHTQTQCRIAEIIRRTLLASPPSQSTTSKYARILIFIKKLILLYLTRVMFVFCLRPTGCGPHTHTHGLKSYFVRRRRRIKTLNGYGNEMRHIINLGAPWTLFCVIFYLNGYVFGVTTTSSKRIIFIILWKIQTLKVRWWLHNFFSSESQRNCR